MLCSCAGLATISPASGQQLGTRLAATGAPAQFVVADRAAMTELQKPANEWTTGIFAFLHSFFGKS